MSSTLHQTFEKNSILVDNILLLHNPDRQIQGDPDDAVGVNCPDVIKMTAYSVMAVLSHVLVISINWLTCLMLSLSYKLLHLRLWSDTRVT